jgi:hypothetical protein
MFEKRKQHLIAAAQPHLEQGETVREVMVGQTFVSPLAYLLIGPIVFIFVVRPRVVMATDRHVYVFAGNMWSQKKLNERLVKQPLQQADVQATKLSLTVGSEKVYALLFQFAPKNEIAATTAGEEPQGELAAA